MYDSSKHIVQHLHRYYCKSLDNTSLNMELTQHFTVVAKTKDALCSGSGILTMTLLIPSKDRLSSIFNKTAI